MAERKGERIYVRNEAGGLEPLVEERFGKEEELQILLAKHPELLDGEQMRPGNPLRWILITREQPISDTVDGAGRWSLDHMIIDQDARPTLVEVKRGNNSEVRRTVVGQMLDYATHASFLKADDLRRTFEDSVANPSAVLASLLGDEEADTIKFWEAVATNLAANRLRLLFVADAIPDELAAIVKFLNEQMPKIEVLAVEIKQFRGETLQTLVPRVIGRLDAHPERSASGGGPRRQLTHKLLFEELDDHVRGASSRLLDVVEECNGHLTWGAGSVTIRAKSADGKTLPVALIYRPGASAAHAGERHFVFGRYGDEPTGELRAFLDEWTAQFASDGFGEQSNIGRRVVSYDDAVANIDLLADRLRTALTEIPKLSNDG